LEQGIELAKSEADAMESIYLALGQRITDVDGRVSVVESRIANFEGTATAQLARLDRLLTTTVILKPRDVIGLIDRRLAEISRREAANQKSLDSAFFHHPRTELRYTATTDFDFYGAAGPSKTFFEIVHARAQHVETFHERTAVETHVAAEGLGPLLRADGTVTRDVSIMCVAYTIRTWGSQNTAGGGLTFIDASASSGSSEEAEARRYSEIITFKYGDKSHIYTIFELTNICRDYAVKHELEGLSTLEAKRVESATFGSTVCSVDYDCRDALLNGGALGVLVPTSISECTYDADKRRNLCSGPRNVAANACSGGAFATPCAKGLTCDARTNRCAPTPVAGFTPNALATRPRPGVVVRDAAGALRSARIRAIKRLGPKAFAAGQAAERDAACAPLGAGWRLPKREELWSVGIWFREDARNRYRDEDPAGRIDAKYYANRWYYVDEAFRGLIFSVDPYVLLLYTDTHAPLNLRDGRSVDQFLGPSQRDRRVSGQVICVQSEIPDTPPPQLPVGLEAAF
jgi:hypothetical protein